MQHSQNLEWQPLQLNFMIQIIISYLKHFSWLVGGSVTTANVGYNMQIKIQSHSIQTKLNGNTIVPWRYKYLRKSMAIKATDKNWSPSHNMQIKIQHHSLQTECNGNTIVPWRYMYLHKLMTNKATNRHWLPSQV